MGHQILHITMEQCNRQLNGFDNARFCISGMLQLAAILDSSEQWGTEKKTIRTLEQFNLRLYEEQWPL